MSEKLSQKDLAERLGVQSRTIYNLVQEGMPAVVVRGKRSYPWPECNLWYIDYKIRLAAPKSDKRKEQLQDLELRKAEVEVRKMELALARDEARVATIEYMEQQWEGLLAGLRGKLMNFSGKHAPDLVGLDTPAQVRAKLDVAIAEVMTALVAVASDESLDDTDGDELARG